MKVNIMDVGGTVVKNNDTYKLTDNNKLNNLVVSSTNLNPFKSTNGHSHLGKEEVYYFISGTGTMYLDKIYKHEVGPGDVILIEDGVHHRVETGADGLYFVCVFDGKRTH